MARTEPINPERKVSLLLKIWLYPNVSAFKIAKAIPAASNWRKNYHDRGFGFFLLLCTEMLILYYAFPNMAIENWRLFFIIFSLLHGVPELFLSRHINEMAFDYYAYYKKALLYIYLVFVLVGIVLLGVSFYNEIGHVK
ncbi:hypothetical protein ACPPVU_10635 [Mucilaginibacter sp. McL0603]|uniref:hypothetical protein n=1 Tax=Mucilaginibacter sp. McL0603 TaxID=3415670 RepID=UPI003CE815E0